MSVVKNYVEDGYIGRVVVIKIIHTRDDQGCDTMMPPEFFDSLKEAQAHVKEQDKPMQSHGGGGHSCSSHLWTSFQIIPLVPRLG